MPKAIGAAGGTPMAAAPPAAAAAASCRATAAVVAISAEITSPAGADSSSAAGLRRWNARTRACAAASRAAPSLPRSRCSSGSSGGAAAWGCRGRGRSVAADGEGRHGLVRRKVQALHAPQWRAARCAPPLHLRSAALGAALRGDPRCFEESPPLETTVNCLRVFTTADQGPPADQGTGGRAERERALLRSGWPAGRLRGKRRRLTKA